jgi:ribonuclease E
VLNHKRAHLRALEERFRITITVSADPAVTGQQSYVIDRAEQVHTPEAARNLAAQQPPLVPTEDTEDEAIESETDEASGLAAAEGEDEPRREGGEREGGSRRRRRRRGRGGRGRGGESRDETQAVTHETMPEPHQDHDADASEDENLGHGQALHESAQGDGEAREGGRRRRRRGRRGGRRNRQRNGDRPSFGGDSSPQPDYQRAVADTDKSPPYENEPASKESTEYRPAPPPEVSAVAGGEQEVPRRRSTIREPASFSSDGPAPANNPSSTPVVSSSGADEPAAPKRGWWGKRLLGDKG